MKKISKALITILLILILTIGTVYAVENEYIVTEELVCKNIRTTSLKRGYIEINIGQKDIVSYQKDGEIKIRPIPDDTKIDEYGNTLIYYDMSNYEPGLEFTVVIERHVIIDSYSADISARTNTVINEESEMYLDSQKRIESNNKKIIAKANELTKELSSDYRKALAIFEYVNTSIKYDSSSSYANQGALSALNSNVGVCEEFATLFVALCRASDIPARVIVGYDLNEEKTTNEEGEIEITYALVDHAWAEIYLEDFNWVPVEPTVIYEPQGVRTPYLNSFCKLEEPNHIATGIYNTEEASISYMGLNEADYDVKVEKVIEDKTPKHEFVDVTEDWYKTSVNSLYEKGIIKGYEDGTFGPGKNITRIEFMCMLSRTLEYLKQVKGTTGQIYYNLDYDEDHWSKEDYDKLMRYFQVTEDYMGSAGYYTLGTVFGTEINVDKAITREETVALMDSFMDESNQECPLTDINKSTFKDSIIKAYSSKIINGYPDGTFKPKGEITRAEMAVILDRYINSKIEIY